MTGWHRGMLCAFDTETTSADPETCRLVTASVAYVDGAGVLSPEMQDWLVNPGVDIPDEATAVHGITTGHAREHGAEPRGAVEEITGELLRAARPLVPVVGFNLAFDFTVLDRETRRLGLEPFGPAIDDARAFVIDAHVIDKAVDPYRKGKRTLTAVAEHYGVRQDAAHSAAGDAVTAARVAWAIANRHPEIASMPATELHAFQVKAKDKQAMSLRAYFGRQGRDEKVDGSWPWRPFAQEAAA